MQSDRSGHYTPYPGASGHREGGGLRPERGGNHDARSYQAIIPYTAHPSRSGALSSRVVARNEQLALYRDPTVARRRRRALQASAGRSKPQRRAVSPTQTPTLRPSLCHMALSLPLLLSTMVRAPPPAWFAPSMLPAAQVAEAMRKIASTPDTLSSSGTKGREPLLRVPPAQCPRPY